MIAALIVIFIIGYLAIAMEHPLKVNKAASALILGMVLWIVYALCSEWLVPFGSPERFAEFMHNNPELASKSLAHRTLQYILNVDIIEHLGDMTQTLFFLIGAMTIVELIDIHGGFRIITEKITTRNKRKLLWILAITTFFMSAVLDNLTTTIVVIMLLNKLVTDKHERWLYAGAIVIAANSGGAWSPIGDVTTIMLWVKGNVTSQALVSYVFLPSLVSLLIPVVLLSFKLHGELLPIEGDMEETSRFTRKQSNTFFFLGVAGLLFVPIFKTLTHLPPFVGMFLVLGILWVYTDIFYNLRKPDGALQYRMPQVIRRIDMPSILFFMGILMAVGVLQSSGILSSLAKFLDDEIHNVYLIDTILGVLSSIVDNVPLVAASMGMYPVEPSTATGYAANFMVDGTFWELLSYAAGVGGSILIIGSAAGVIAMGIEKISFGWYLKRVSWLALIGYLCGVAVYLAEHLIRG